jgi:hypothetical protein
MAKDIRSLVVDTGITKQIANDDTLLVGVGVKPSSGTSLTIGAADTDVSVPGSMVIDGDLDVQGAIGVVSTTTFQQDATFLGNVSFGDTDSPVDDTVSFANATINSDINFDGLGHKITNLAAPSDDNDAARKVYVDDGLDLKLDLAGGTMSGAIAMGSNAITGLAAPSDDNDAARKVYVDDADALKLDLAGGTMSGAIEMSSNKVTGLAAPTDDNDAARKVYVDDGLDLKLDLAGGTMSGAIEMGSNAITGLSDPNDAQDAATKNYADGHLGGVAYTFPAADGASGQVLKTDGAGVLSWEADVSAPAGNDTEIQFNNGGVFGASANLIWDGSALGVTGDVTVSANLKADGELWIDEESTLPDGEAGYGKLAAKSNALYFVDATGQAHYTMPDGLLALSGAAQTLDFDPELPSFRDLPLSGNTTFSTDSASLAAGRSMSIRLDNSAGGSARVLTFPNTAGAQKWTWLGGSPPAQVDAGDVAVISLMCYGTTDESIVAAWSYSESVQITGSGTAGEVAYFDGERTIKSEGGLKWDETNDRLNIGNADNSAHSANLRVGGSAHIGGEVFLDGNVDLGDAAGDAITVNGAMSLASGASFDGTAGTVDLPAQFSIDGSAVSANVSAANLNTLTGGSDASALHSHKANAIDGLTTTGTVAGDVVYVSANDTVLKGDPTDINMSFILGVVTAAGVVATSGRVAANFAASLSPAPAAGKPCYLAADGKLTTVAPTSGVIADVGIVLNASLYSTAGTCEISLAIKPTIQLV